MTTIAGELRIGGTVFQAGDSLADVQDAIDRLEQELRQLRAEVDFVQYGHLRDEQVVPPPRLEGDDIPHEEPDISFSDPDDEPEAPEKENKPHKRRAKRR